MKSLLKFAQFCHQDKYKEFNLEPLPEWIWFVWDGGWCTQDIANGLSAMDSLWVAKGMYPKSKDTLVQYLLNKFRKDYKERALPRAHLALTQVQRIISRPPPRVASSFWSSYFWIAWAFGIRHMELRMTLPHHIEKYVKRPRKVKKRSDGRAPVKKRQHKKKGIFYRLRIVCPKVGKKGVQHVTVPLSTLTTPCICAIDSFRLTKWPKPAIVSFKKMPEDYPEFWHKTLPRSAVIPRLRKALDMTDERTDVVFHSMRHGRASQLFDFYDWSLNRLRKFGRWMSKGAARIYLHS